MSLIDPTVPPALRPTLPDEAARLAALHALAVLDTPPDAALDTITRLAADRFGTPTALVSLVDADRQWFKSRFGLDANQTCRSDSFCGHAITGDAVMVVLDAAADPRFRANPLVTGDPHIRFYAGAPLVLESGHNVGTLCLIDPAPRKRFDAHEQDILALMAGQVVGLLEAARLRQQQRISQLIAETTSDAFVCSDPHSRIILWNRGAETMFGWSAEEAIGQSLELIIPDRHRQAHHHGMAGLRARGPIKLVGKTVEVPARCKDGREIPVELSLGMWPAPGLCEPEGFAAIIRDVSARHHAESQLARQAAAIAAAEDGIALTDANGCFQYMNPAHARMFGYEAVDELIGCQWSMLYHADEAQWIRDVVMPALGARGQWRGETRGRKRDGSAVEQEISLSLSEEGGIVCVTRDVGQRRAIEREGAQLREQVMLAQRQEVVGQLASGIAHDFNNVIAAIASTAEQLRICGDEQVRQQALRIKSAATSAGGLVDKLMNIGRRTPELKLIDLRRTVWSARDLVAPSLADPLHRIELDLPGTPLLGMADETEVTQVLLNLVLNARDALRAGEVGRIKLEVMPALSYRPEGTVVVGSVPDVPAAVIRISDTGCGIAPDDIARVFEPFYTQKGADGTGLGLAVVAGIIAGNRASLAIQSWPDCGTVFEVCWPLEPIRDDQVDDSGAQGATGLRLTGQSVLVAEDEPVMLDHLATLLQDLGMTVAACARPKDALAALRANPAAWDLLVTDYLMPGMTGAHLAEAARQLRPDLPVLLLTGMPRGPQLQERVSGQYDAVLAKPVNAASLEAAAATALAAARDRHRTSTS